jgi:hypothetical protein
VPAELRCFPGITPVVPSRAKDESGKAIPSRIILDHPGDIKYFIPSGMFPDHPRTSTGALPGCETVALLIWKKKFSSFILNNLRRVIVSS